MRVTQHISPVNIEERAKADIRPGDTVRVWQRIKEGDKTRLQAFEGIVIARKHGREPGATITVRRVSSGVGVEKIFPLFSPVIEKLEVVKRSRMRRAKLYYIREKAAREIRKKMRRMRLEGTEVISADQQQDTSGGEDSSPEESEKADKDREDADTVSVAEGEEKDQKAPDASEGS